MNIATLYEKKDSAKEFLIPELQKLYGGDLSFPEKPKGRPYVIGNFVETIDGVVSFLIPGRSSGQPISCGSREDHFVMGLLRSVADAVLIGSGTLRGDPGRVRIPEVIYPEAKGLYADLRKKLGKSPLPMNVVLTASGKIDPDEPTFHTEGLRSAIITTEEGLAYINNSYAGKLDGVVVHSTGESGSTSPDEVLKVLTNEFGTALLLHEGGPAVFGQFLADQKIDELFLTVAPQIAGRSKTKGRPSIAGETIFSPETAPWLDLASIKRGSDHLLLRYIRKS